MAKNIIKGIYLFGAGLKPRYKKRDSAYLVFVVAFRSPY